MELKEQMRHFILRELCFDDSIQFLADDEQLIERGIIDSLGIVRLLAYLDKNFGILLSEDELNTKNFATLKSICNLVAKKLQKN